MLIEKLFDIIQSKAQIAQEDIEELSLQLDIHQNKIKEVISFYKEFVYKDQNQFYVCFGISCIERGAKEIYGYLKSKGYKVEKSYCFKKCAQSPVVKTKDSFILKAKISDILDSAKKVLHREFLFNGPIQY